MQQIKQGYAYEDVPEEEELETLHVYVYPDKPRKQLSPNTRDTIIASTALVVLAACLVALCLIPSTPAYAIATITVPAHFSLKVMQADVTIIPTGIHTYPATRASGTLTIYNGSFLTQQLPAHFILTASSGIEIVTDEAVDIPAGNPPSYGTATVAAYASAAGSNGNIQPGAIDAVYGSSLYIKNLAPFTGGKDATSTIYATSADKAKALEAAQSQLIAQQPIGLLARPCTEQATQKALNLAVLRECQYATYMRPKGVQVLSVRVSGESVVLRVRVAIVPPRGQYWR
jgi:hypothetical protein